MATELSTVEYGYKSRPSALMNSIFMSTVNTAAKTLVAMASTSRAEHTEKWKPVDHLRFMLMLMTWLTVWVLRVLMDHFPCFLTSSPTNLLGGFSFDLPLLPASSSSSALSASSSSVSALDLVLHDQFDGPSNEALGRALTQIFALLNEIPATSRKYQFAVAMADKIVDENARDGHVELLRINRVTLGSAFAPWPSRIIQAIPLGSFFVSCVSAIFHSVVNDGTSVLQRRQQLAVAQGESSGDIVAEKLAQELLWMTNKLKACGAVDEALMQWSFASGLASVSLTATPRVQGLFVKISAMLFGEVSDKNMEVPVQVKFRLLVLWLPLFCYAGNGFAYPVLTSYEKAELERAMDEVISSLPAIDQEVVLTNWLQDFTMSASDWPNLQVSYNRWCQSTRQLVT
ncbi:hypothetical protein L1049_023058 [Liquidambar formosana]|uniref:At3g05675-like ankyrin-like domain-containing protein n=1 Tax=Liquidambar formosana TaxID=63359 RepID=A0AAP0RDZ1_LIQFO